MAKHAGMNRWATILMGLLLTAWLATGCGGDSGNSSDSGSTTSQDQVPAVTGKSGQKPEIAQPEGDPPDKLIVKDLKKGKGKKAKDGDTVSVQYVGVDWTNGQEFDASWDRGEPFSFELGAGQVIPGWDEGVKGMRVGGRRELVIPPDLAYGPQGQPPAIGPNETLVFVVDLEKVKS